MYPEIRIHPLHWWSHRAGYSLDGISPLTPPVHPSSRRVQRVILGCLTWASLHSVNVKLILNAFI